LKLACFAEQEHFPELRTIQSGLKIFNMTWQRITGELRTSSLQLRKWSYRHQ